MTNKYQSYNGKSIAQQLLAGTALGNWLAGGEFKSGKQTYTDGYGAQRSDASLRESANGQELERMRDTTKTAGTKIGNKLMNKEMGPMLGGKPFELKQNIPVKMHPDQVKYPSLYLYDFKNGGVLSGKSGIHIKPENRGKFTRLKKRTGKSSTWYKEHGTPAQKKMAIFALNAKKWKH